MEVKFLTELSFSPVTKDVYAPWLDGSRNKFRIAEDFVIEVVDEKGITNVIVVPEGYITDMSSIPRFVWWLFPPSSTGARYASVPHDIIYSHYYHYFSKEYADKLFLAIMEKRNASGFMKRAFYYAVKFGGKGGWDYAKDPDSDPHWHKKHPLLRWRERRNKRKNK